MQDPVTIQGCKTVYVERVALTVIGLAAVLLRVVWLDSDAYARLSWSSALLTDEGFYLHNARNQVLFGHARLDGFNNMLIMPLLHLGQVGWFRLVGVGLVQARLLSVGCSLLTLGLFWDGLRRAFGRRVAGWGVVFLGLDHVNLLYNRLALMDTPGALFLVAGWWAFVRGSWVLCGVVLGAGYGVRGLDALVWPAAIAVLLWQRQSRPALQIAAGLTAAMFIYVMLWWVPRHSEIAIANHYYLSQLLIPHRLVTLGSNSARALFSWQRGIFPYLLKHTPVQITLCALAPLIYAAFCVSEFSDKVKVGRCLTLEYLRPLVSASREMCYLMIWFWTLFAFMASISYAPSRYYVLLYPPMAAISAYLVNSMLAGRKRLPAIGYTLALVWLCVNAGWGTDWLTHLSYQRRDAERWMIQHLPANSILIGDVAPSLAIGSRFKVINVIAGLCNDSHPIERYASSSSYVVILDDRWKENWWTRNYPLIVAPNNRVIAFHGMLRPFFTVGVYAVNGIHSRSH